MKFPNMSNIFHFTGCSAAGSASALGAECRRFKSCHPDSIKLFFFPSSIRQLTDFFYFLVFLLVNTYL